MTKGFSQKRNCCICNNIIKRYGNNPYPVHGDACCDSCNTNLVVPLRMLFIELYKKDIALYITDTEVMLVKPINKHFTLEELQKLVNGYIEINESPFSEYVIICNEEGSIKELYYNQTASLIAGTNYKGNILICPKELIK